MAKQKYSYDAESASSKKYNASSKKGNVQKKNDLLQGQVYAAETIYRAALKIIAQRKLPDVVKCKNSLQAWQQLWKFIRIWNRSLRGTFKSHTNVDIRDGASSDPMQYEGIGSHVAKAFGHWLWMLIQEIVIVIVLIINWVLVKLGKFISFIAFQIGRFFRWIAYRMKWKKLKYSILAEDKRRKFKAWRNKTQAASAERRINREVEAQERAARKKDEAEFRAARKKEEQAIREARLKEAKAQHSTEDLEAQLAALSQKRKAEEEKVSLEVQRNEETQALLLEQIKKEEEIREQLEIKRKEEEAARLEAAREAEEARKRLAVLEKEERERQRLEAVRIEEEKRLKLEAEKREKELREAEQERIRLEKERKAEEERIRLEQEKKAEEERIRLEQEKKAEEERRRLEQEKKAEEERRRLEQEKKAEALKSEEPAEGTTAESRKEEQNAGHDEGSYSAETIAQAAILSEQARHENRRRQAEKTSRKDERQKEADIKVQAEKKEELLHKVEKQREKQGEDHSNSRRELNPVPAVQRGAAIAATAVRSAVKSIPVSIPSVGTESIGETMVEARDKTSNFIRRIILSSEHREVYGNPVAALKYTVLKYAILGAIAATAAYIGITRSSDTSIEPGIGIFLLMFIIIFVFGSILEAGLGYLAGLLLNQKYGSCKETAVLEKNAVYTLTSTAAFAFCLCVLAFNKGKFVAVFAAVLILAMIGHIWVMYHVSKGHRGYTLLVYLLCLIIVVAVVLLLVVVFRSQLMTLWNALG